MIGKVRGFCRGILFGKVTKFGNSVRSDGAPVRISPTGPLGETADAFTLSLPEFRLSDDSV
jgi:hypothetical protein